MKNPLCWLGWHKDRWHIIRKDHTVWHRYVCVRWGCRRIARDYQDVGIAVPWRPDT